MVDFGGSVQLTTFLTSLLLPSLLTSPLLFPYLYALSSASALSSPLINLYRFLLYWINYSFGTEIFITKLTVFELELSDVKMVKIKHHSS